MNNYSPLPKEEVKKAIYRQNPSRIPLIRAKWWGEGLTEQYGNRLSAFDKYPEDVVQPFFDNLIDFPNLGLSWELGSGGALDNKPVIDQWSKLDEFIDKLPDPDRDERFENIVLESEKAKQEGLYLLFSWWNLFFERAWTIRGMENLMVDFYTEPEQVHKLMDALASLYERYIRKAFELIQPEGFFTSDDLGHQSGPMMSPDLFRGLLLPYFTRIGSVCEELEIDFWLHSCGDNTLLLPDLIQAGVKVFHPVQKHTMDEEETAQTFAGQISFLAGIDVQHTLQEASPEEVKREVRYLIDTFDTPSGGMCIAAGNGIVGGTPIENIQAFLEEALRYGEEHRQR